MSLLANRYAKALFEVAEAAGVSEQISRDLQRMGAALESPGIRALVTSPETTTQRRQHVLDKATEGCHPLMTNLVGVVLRRRRQGILMDLPEAFEELRRNARGEVLGVVESARPMVESDVRRLEQHASKLVGKSVKLAVNEDPDLIGGVRIRIGNTLYDGSMAAALEELAQKLSNAQLP